MAYGQGLRYPGSKSEERDEGEGRPVGLPNEPQLVMSAEDIARLAEQCQRGAVFAADEFCLNNSDLIAKVPQAYRNAAIIRVALSFLIGFGLVTVNDDPAAWEQWFPVQLPDELRRPLLDNLEKRAAQFGRR